MVTQEKFLRGLKTSLYLNVETVCYLVLDSSLLSFAIEVTSDCYWKFPSSKGIMLWLCIGYDVTVL